MKDSPYNVEYNIGEKSRSSLHLSFVVMEFHNKYKHCILYLMAISPQMQ